MAIKRHKEGRDEGCYLHYLLKMGLDKVHLNDIMLYDLWFSCMRLKYH